MLLVADEFSAENGTLTASMKSRCQAVAERYRQQIEEMYGAGGNSRAGDHE